MMSDQMMHAWRLRNDPGPIEDGPLEWTVEPVPRPAPDEVLVRVLACGVCRTDLHVSEGDLPVHRPHVTPGHEVVGEVTDLGSHAAVGMAGARIRRGEHVGIAWLRHTCGRCGFCWRGAENLCVHSLYTGWDANGGYAEYATAPADYVYPLDALLGEGNGSGVRYAPESAAPLLCAGIIGYRSLKRTGLLARSASAATDRQPVLGLYGFGGSAHITAQVALALGMRVHVLTRGEASRKLALRLGCASAAGAYDMPPEPLDAAIIFAPVGAMVPVALRALRSGGVLSLAGIHMSDTPPLNYEHELFHEKEIRSVESNTRADGREFLAFASHHRIAVDTHRYPLDHGQQALQDLKAGVFAGAAVLIP